MDNGVLAYLWNVISWMHWLNKKTLKFLFRGGGAEHGATTISTDSKLRGFYSKLCWYIPIFFVFLP